MNQFKLSYSLMLFLIAGTVLFARGFSYLKIDVLWLPLYITEFVCLFIAAAVFFDWALRGKVRFEILPYTGLFCVLFVVFLIALFRGLAMYEDKVFVLRQSALLYYAVFYFLAPIVFNSLGRVKLLFKVFMWCALISSIAEITALNIYGLGGFAYYYAAICLIFIIAHAVLKREKVSKTIYWLMFVYGYVLLTSRARAAWVGVACVLAMVLYLSEKYKKIGFLRTRLIKYVILIVTGSVIIAGITKPKAIADIAVEFISIMTPLSKSGPDNNILWRLYVWSDIVKETMEKPVLGWGFGKKFIPKTIKKLNWGGSWHDPKKLFQDPHNSYLSVLYRTGITGFLVFCAILVKFFGYSKRTMFNIKDNDEIRGYILCLFLVGVFIAGTSFFMVILEGPFLGIFFWITFGLIVSLKKIHDRSLVPEKAAAA